jgi:hypothetical protein
MWRWEQWLGWGQLPLVLWRWPIGLLSQKRKKEKEKRIGVAYTSHGLGVSHGTCLCLIPILGSVTNTKYYIVVVFKAASHGIPSPKSHSCYQVPTWRQNLTFRASRHHQNMVCIHISWIKKVYVKEVTVLVLRVGSSFFCSTQLSTQVPSLTSKKYYHVGVHVIPGT